MERLQLAVRPREKLGKKVRQLRKEGLIPANIFGKDIKSTPIQFTFKEFNAIFREAGETSLIDVKLGEKVFPSLINNIQREPVFDQILHVDFHKVNLKEKITAHVPVVLVGESPAEKSGVGLLLQTLNEVEVESLPTDIPQQISVNVENLTEVGQSIHVKDLKFDREKVEIKNDPEEVVVTVQTAEMKEEVEEATPTSLEEVEAIAEKGGDEVEGEEEKSQGREEKDEG